MATKADFAVDGSIFLYMQFIQVLNFIADFLCIAKLGMCLMHSVDTRLYKSYQLPKELVARLLHSTNEDTLLKCMLKCAILPQVKIHYK